MSFSPTKMIQLTQMGCVISPYRKRQSPMIEQYTGTFDKVYFRYNPYVGFMVPYHGVNAFVTYRRDVDFLNRAFPFYDMQNVPLIQAKTLYNMPSFDNSVVLREVQNQILLQIEKELRFNNVWFVNLQTDSGKTMLSAYLSIRLGLKTWICCYSKEILKQWYDTYDKHTSIPRDRIIHVDSAMIDKILAGEVDPDDYDIFISTPRVLDSFGDRRSNYEVIGSLFTKCGIGLFVYDEAHRWVSDFVKIVSCANPRYILALSADFSQGDREKEDMFKRVFQTASVLVPTEDLQQRLKSNKIRVIYFNSHPTAVEKNEIFNRYGYDATMYAKYEFKKQILPQAILFMLHNAFDMRDPECKDRGLILFQNVQHVDDFYTLCRMHFPHLKIGRFHGSVSDEAKQFAKDEADLIVATYSSFSTGLHTHDIRYIYSTNQCNKVQDNQAAGRSSNSYYFMFVDTGFSYCMNKLKKRLEYLLVTKAQDGFMSFTYHPHINPMQL